MPEYARQLTTAVKKNDFRALEILAWNGADLHANNEANGSSLLHLACAVGDREMCLWLIEKGVNIDNLDDSGWPPFFEAVCNRNCEVITLLYELNAKIDTKANDGCNALHLAAQEGHIGIVHWLIEQGLEVDELNDDGDSPLYGAAFCGQLNTCKVLVQAGSDITQKNKKGSGLMHAAVRQGCKDVVRFLHRKGLGVTDLDNKGFTPLFIAEFYGMSSTCKLLVLLGANWGELESSFWKRMATKATKATAQREEEESRREISRANGRAVDSPAIELSEGTKFGTVVLAKDTEVTPTTSLACVSETENKWRTEIRVVSVKG